MDHVKVLLMHVLLYSHIVPLVNLEMHLGEVNTRSIDRQLFNDF